VIGEFIDQLDLMPTDPDTGEVEEMIKTSATFNPVL